MADLVFGIGKTYSFEVYPSAIFGTNFKGVVVTATVSPSIASKLGYDIDALHAQAAPFLPTGFIDNPRGYNYIQIKFPSGTETIIGTEWIKPSTIEETSGTTITAVINGVTASEASVLRNILKANGFTDFTLTVS